MKIMPVNGNYANKKNSSQNTPNNIAFGMNVQLDTVSVAKALDKIKDPIARLGILKKIREVVSNLNENVGMRFSIAMDEFLAPQDIRPDDIKGYKEAVVKVFLGNAPIKAGKGLTYVDLISGSLSSKGTATAVNTVPDSFETAINSAFDDFVKNVLEKSEIFKSRMAKVRAAAEVEYNRLLGRG